MWVVVLEVGGLDEDLEVGLEMALLHGCSPRSCLFDTFYSGRQLKGRCFHLDNIDFLHRTRHCLHGGAMGVSLVSL